MFEMTENSLTNQIRTIKKKGLLTKVKLDEIQTRVKNEKKIAVPCDSEMVNDLVIQDETFEKLVADMEETMEQLLDTEPDKNVKEMLGEENHSLLTRLKEIMNGEVRKRVQKLRNFDKVKYRR